MLLAHPRRCGGQETMAAVERQRRRSTTTAAVKKQLRRSSKQFSNPGESTMSGGDNSSHVVISRCFSKAAHESFSSRISSLTNGSCKHHDRRCCFLTADVFRAPLSFSLFFSRWSLPTRRAPR